MQRRNLPEMRIDREEMSKNGLFLPEAIDVRSGRQGAGQGLQGFRGRKDNAAGNVMIAQVRRHGYDHGNGYRFDGQGKAFHS